MNLATWTSIKSPIMQEIRAALKKKPEKGGPSISRKEANRVWREDILGIHSEEQRQKIKEQRQKRGHRNKETDFEYEQ
jgi:hypothetical protein